MKKQNSQKSKVTIAKEIALAW